MNYESVLIVSDITSAGEPEINTTDVAVTFGHMLDIYRGAKGAGLLESYQSDLWHDANTLSQWLGKHSTHLYWHIRQCGTYMYRSLEGVEPDKGQLYDISLRKKDRKTRLKIHRLIPKEQ